MTKDEIIKEHYPYYNPDIAQRDIEINADAVKKLMEKYWIDQLKGLYQDLHGIRSECILERINDEIKSSDYGVM